jgi:hypothetical protein
VKVGDSACMCCLGVRMQILSFSVSVSNRALGSKANMGACVACKPKFEQTLCRVCCLLLLFSGCTLCAKGFERLHKSLGMGKVILHICTEHLYVWVTPLLEALCLSGLRRSAAPALDSHRVRSVTLGADRSHDWGQDHEYCLTTSSIRTA